MSRILLVDDDESIRSSLSRVLERAGYEVVVAADGREGIQRCRDARPDLVMTDIHMPEFDGIEVILALGSAAPGLPVIVMSGGNRTEQFDLLADAVVLGAVEALRKPFSADEVLAAVRRALGE